MRLDTKLAKLEQKAKFTLKCPWCRFILVDTPPSQVKSVAANTTDFAPTSCSWCGHSYTLDLRGMSEHQREALLIYYGKDDGEIYTDKRVAAAYTWFHASRVIVEWREGKLQKKLAREDAKANQTYQQKRAAEKEKAARKATPQAKIKEQAYAFYRKMAQREEKMYGPAKHDLHVEIARLSHLQVDRLGYAPEPFNYQKMSAKEKAIRTVVYQASVMQLCELVVWGKLLPVTAEILKHAKNLAQSFVEERIQKQLEKEEAARLKEEERARETAEYHAKKAAQQSPAPRTAIVPVNIPSNDVGSDLLDGARDEAEDAIEDLRKRISQTIRTDAQGRKPIEMPYIPPDPRDFKTSTLPVDDGSDPYYYQRLEYYKRRGVWADDRMLGLLGLGR